MHKIVELKKIIAIALLALIMSINMPIASYVQAYDFPTAPIPPPPPTYEEVAPTPPPTPTYEDSTTEEQSTSEVENSQSAQSSENETVDEYSGTEAVNSDNGSDSNNDSNINSNSDTSQDSSNDANVSNDLNVGVVTGDNDSSGNTGGISSIETGDATAGITVETDVNTTVISGSGCCFQSDTSAINSQNGSGSDNSASVSSNSNDSTTVDNDAEIQTDLNAFAITGDNDASKNVGDSVIITGDANLQATVITDANTTSMGVYNFDVNGNQTGDLVLGEFDNNCVNCQSDGGILAQNSQNGSDSDNSANIDVSNTSTETINNDADIVNNINLLADSGGNNANKNTGGDSTITTGEANVAANVLNTVNTVVSGVIYTVNIFGNLVGDIILPQTAGSTGGCSNCCGQNITATDTGNGTDSQNTTDVNVDNSSKTSQTNNAVITNNLNLNGNTGSNDASFNTAGDSVIDSGQVDISANTLNIANVNVSGSACDEPIYLVFVNLLGEWVGQILGAPTGSHFYGSDGILYTVGPNGEIIATNSQNGSGSTNTNNINVNNDSTTTQTNNATLTNNINIEANTGNNSTSKNTGGNNSITTGDANIALNIVNFVNSNFSGRKVILTMVNVFGSFFGNIVTPGHASGGNDNGSNNQDNSSPGSSSGGSSSSSSSGSGSNSQNTETSQGQILAVAISKFKGGSQGQQDQSETTSTSDSLANDVTEVAGGFNWRWLLLALPLAVILLFWKRNQIAGLLRK